MVGIGSCPFGAKGCSNFAHFQGCLLLVLWNPTYHPNKKVGVPWCNQELARHRLDLSAETIHGSNGRDVSASETLPFQTCWFRILGYFAALSAKEAETEVVQTSHIIIMYHIYGWYIWMMHVFLGVKLMEINSNLFCRQFILGKLSFKTQPQSPVRLDVGSAQKCPIRMIRTCLLVLKTGHYSPRLPIKLKSSALRIYIIYIIYNLQNPHDC